MATMVSWPFEETIISFVMRIAPGRPDGRDTAGIARHEHAARQQADGDRRLEPVHGRHREDPHRLPVVARGKMSSRAGPGHHPQRTC
jgi:hypothetical protein